MSVNKVILLGHVGRDPEVRYPEKDLPVASFSLATNSRNSSGTEVTEWHNIVMFRKAAEHAEKYIRKGTRLYLEGRLHTREYEDRFKIRRRITEIIADNFEILGRSAEGPSQPV